MVKAQLEEEVQQELDTCQRQKEMLESQARESFMKAKVRMAQLERSAIERRKQAANVEESEARMRREFDLLTRAKVAELFPVESEDMSVVSGSQFKPKLIWGKNSRLQGCEVTDKKMKMPESNLPAKKVVEKHKVVVRRAGKPRLADLPLNKDHILEWREHVNGRGSVADIIATEQLIEDADILDGLDDEDYVDPSHWARQRAQLKAGAWGKGGSMERSGIQLETNVDPKNMSTFAKEEFIEEIAAQLGVPASQIRITT